MFKIQKVLGSGGFGVVLSAVDIKHQKNVALKVVLRREKRDEMLIFEYNLLKDLNHPNIIKIY
jgi:serine/threonine protein kinase